MDGNTNGEKMHPANNYTYLKLHRWTRRKALCITGTIIYICWFDWHFDPDRSTVIAIAVAIPNCIITVGVLILMMVLDKKNDMTELCLNGAGGALNLALGTLLLCYVGNRSSAFYLVLAITTAVCGVLMLLDCVRLVKSGAVSM